MARGQESVHLGLPMAYCSECSASLPEGAVTCPTCGAAAIATPTGGGGPATSRPTLDAGRLQPELAAALAPRYEVLRPLGEGGMGLVFLAREPALKRLVAVKLLAPDLADDPAARARFEREARAAAALSHPNVVRVYAVGETPDLHLPFIIMQYVEGSTLAEAISARGRMSERECRRILGEVASALSAAHARELVHRDVKPSNVLIENDTGRAYVADFGVSAALSPALRAEQTRLTATGMMIGTPVYMSPEQASADEVGPASDVYSLGILAYELLTGELPFAATTPMGWAAAHLRDTPAPVASRRADLSPEVGLLVDRCLGKRLSDRPTAGEVARGMLPSIESEVPWPPPGLHALHGRARLLARLSLVCAAAGLLVIFALAFPPESVVARPPADPAVEALAGGPSVGAVAPAATADARYVLWQGLLILGLIAAASGVLGLFAVLQRSVVGILRSRTFGWTWGTVADVLADADGRSGLILSGAREFASLEAGTRRAILRSRRQAAGAELVTGVWVLAVLATQMVAGMVAGDTSGNVAPVLDDWVAVVAAVPAVAALVAAARLRLQARTLLGPLAVRRTIGVEPEDVAAWYAVLGGPPPPVVPVRRPRVAGGASGLALMLAGAMLLLALGGSVGSALLAGRNARSVRTRATSLLANIQRYREEDALGAAAALVSGYLPSPEPATDSAVAAWVRTLSRRAADREPPYPERFGELRQLARAAFPIEGGVGPGVVLRAALEGRLGRDMLRGIAEIAEHPRTIMFRRLARAPQPDFVTALLDQPVAAYTSWFALPWSLDYGLVEAAEANAIAALGDAARHDLAGAVARLGENAAIAQHVLNAPAPGARWLGRTVLRWSLIPMGRIELQRGNVARADSLGRAAQRLRSGRAWLGSASGLATDLHDLPRLRDVLADRRFTPGQRLEWLNDAWLGFCANPRELAFGPSTARRDSLAALAREMRDVAHASELATLMAKGWNEPSRYLFGESLVGSLFGRSVANAMFRASICATLL